MHALGTIPPRHGVYAVGSTKRGPVELMRMLPVANKGSLPLETMTLGEAMKQAGYATGMFGKCHLTDSAQGKSERRGFDVVEVSQHGLNSKDPDDPKGIFSITAAACEFIEANRQRPFFAYLPHYAVHSSLQGRPETLKRFKRQVPGEKHDDPLFAACLADLDTGIGMVLEKLKELNLDEKTLVLFTSDNGGTAVSQEPLRGKKGCYYEGGIRVPMIVRWPGIVAAGSTCDVPVINVDFYPTFLDVAGADSARSSPLDGASLLPLLQGEPALKRQAIFWHFPGYLNGPVPRGRDPVFRTRPVSVIRKGNWKLHLYHEEWQLDGGGKKLASNNAAELYNVAVDPGERNDLANTKLAERDELLADLLAWMDRISAPLPSEPNPQWRAAEATPQSEKKKNKRN